MQRENRRSYVLKFPRYFILDCVLHRFRSLPSGRGTPSRQASVFLHQVSTSPLYLLSEQALYVLQYCLLRLNFPFSVHFSSRGQSNEAPATEGHHYCVDENTERRNHYLDLAGIENYTSRFEGKCLTACLWFLGC